MSEIKLATMQSARNLLAYISDDFVENMTTALWQLALWPACMLSGAKHENTNRKNELLRLVINHLKNKWYR